MWRRTVSAVPLAGERLGDRRRREGVLAQAQAMAGLGTADRVQRRLFMGSLPSIFSSTPCLYRVCIKEAASNLYIILFSA